MRKILAITLVIATMSIGLIGCSTKEEPVIAVIEGEKVTESLYRTYLWSTQQFFEQLSGPTIWDMELEGKKTPDIAKERALESTTLSIVTTKKAEELGIELTKEEKKAIKDNAENFMKVNGEVAKTYQFDQKAIEQLLTSTSLSEKVQVKISENYIPTEEEITKYIADYKPMYEQVRVKHVLISRVDEENQPLPEDKQKEKLALAEEILKKALAGEDMTKLAETYSEDTASLQDGQGGEYTFERGKMLPEFEQAAFDGVDGEVWPELVQTTDGYYIIKTEEHISADEEKMKEEYIQKAKNEFSTSELEDMIKNAKVEKTLAYEELTIIKPEPETAEATADTTPETDTKEKE